MPARRKRWPIACGVVWSLLFACMSFYWAGGGKLGVDTLGPEISRQAVLRDEGFILVVWITGAAKAAGALLLLALTIRWNSGRVQYSAPLHRHDRRNFSFPLRAAKLRGGAACAGSCVELAGRPLLSLVAAPVLGAVLDGGRAVIFRFRPDGENRRCY